MRRARGFVERINRHRREDAEFDGHRLLERGATLRLRYVMRERRPRQINAGALGLGRGGLRLGAADRGDAAFAARDALRGFVQIADRALAADRAVISVFRFDPKTIGELPFGIAVAPAEEIDDVERVDFAKQFAAAVLLGALERFDQEGERFEALGNLFWTIDDFADADDDGDKVMGEGGGWHCFLFRFLGSQFTRVFSPSLRAQAKQSI